MHRVVLYLARLAETQLRQDPPRRDVPVPDTRPQPAIAGRSYPRDHSPTRLGGVTEAMRRAQQLIGQLRFVFRSGVVEDESAIADDVTGVLALHRQQPWPLPLGADLRSDVLDGRPTLGADPPMLRYPRIPFHPQLTVDAGLVHAAPAKDQAIGRQRVQCRSARHLDIVAVRWHRRNPPPAPRPGRRTTRSAALDTLRLALVTTTAGAAAATAAAAGVLLRPHSWWPAESCPRRSAPPVRPPKPARRRSRCAACHLLRRSAAETAPAGVWTVRSDRHWRHRCGPPPAGERFLPAWCRLPGCGGPARNRARPGCPG